METVRLLPAAGIALCTALFAGCTDQYEEGRAAGYADGYADARRIEQASCQDKLASAEESCRPSRYFGSGSYSTEVCGGAGANVNGKHYRPGKTGCVRVYSDGRVERY